MYKVKPDRNIFFEINLKLSGVAYSSVLDFNIFGLRTWFDVTKSVTELINQTKKVQKTTHDEIKQIKKYFEDSYLLYKNGNAECFPTNPTVKYLSEQSNFSQEQIKKVLAGKINGSRDFIISMCFAFKLNIIESNLLLKAYGYNELYDKDLRDVLIIKSIYDFFIDENFIVSNIPIIELNERLYNNELDIISGENSRKGKK